MDRDQARQFALFGWIVFIFVVYPSALGWLTWKGITYFNLPKGLILVGVSIGLFISTFHLLMRVKQEEARQKAEEGTKKIGHES